MSKQTIKKRNIKLLIIIFVITAITITILLNLNKNQELKMISAKTPAVLKSPGDNVIGEWDVSINNDGKIIATLYDDGRLVMSGTGKTKEWNEDSTEDYHNSEISPLVEHAIVNEGITVIGSYVFANCENLTTVEIPDSVTRIGGDTGIATIVGIDEDEQQDLNNTIYVAFLNCKNLKNINVSSDNTRYSSINGILFNKDQTEIQCYPTGKELTEYSIPDSVIKIRSYAFKNAIHLTSINIPEEVTKIGNFAFDSCTSLDEIEIPKNVNNIGYSSTMYVTMEGGYENYDTREEKVFNNCSSLKNINVDSENMKYSSIDGVLFNKEQTEIMCFPEGKQVTTYTVPRGVIYINPFAFANCKYVNNVKILEDVIEIKEYAFSNCTGLKSIEISKSVSKIELLISLIELLSSSLPQSRSSFVGCSNLEIIIIDDDNPSYCSIDNVILNKEKTRIIYYPEGKKNSKYVIPDSVNYITNTILISGCENLKQLVVSNEHASIVFLGNLELYYGKVPTIICKSNSDIEQSAIDKGIDYQVDDDAPEIEIEGNTTTPTRDDIKVNIRDSLAGLKSVTVNNTILDINGDEVSYTITENGTYTIEAIDNLGNIINQEINITNIDKTLQEELEIIFDGYSEVEQNNKNYVKGIDVNTTLQGIISKITTNGTIKIYKNDSEITNNNEKISTGMKLKVSLNGEDTEYILVVKGDSNGDGKADISDILAINKHRLNKALLANEYFLAGDVIYDGKVDIKDILQINKFRLGKINNL